MDVVMEYDGESGLAPSLENGDDDDGDGFVVSCFCGCSPKGERF